MKYISLMFVAVIFVSGVETHPALCQRATPRSTRATRRFKPFSAESNYMSLSGYVRYRVLRQQGRWIARSKGTLYLFALLQQKEDIERELEKYSTPTRGQQNNAQLPLEVIELEKRLQETNRGIQKALTVGARGPAQ
jgi:hypothetical protein